jgi:hypothetical protein
VSALEFACSLVAAGMTDHFPPVAAQFVFATFVFEGLECYTNQFLPAPSVSVRTAWPSYGHT